MKIGIIKEGKIPRDTRTPLTPHQCVELQKQFPSVEVLVQSCAYRCFTDAEYIAHGISVVDDVSHCTVLLGIKEVPLAELVENKTYFFFSHTIKKQAHNRKLLQAILEKNITLIDYETLVDENEVRVIAFGYWAGVVGAHNGVYTWGKRTKQFDLPRMCETKDLKTVQALYKNIDFGAVRIVLTGNGRVASGAVDTLLAMGFTKITPEKFCTEKTNSAVFTQLADEDMFALPNTPKETFNKPDFYKNPQNYISIFEPYTMCSDVMINGIYWDNKAPAFFTVEDMKKTNFSIQVIADITCDIAPQASIPSTIKASTIAEPVFGFNPHIAAEEAPYSERVIDMMTIDNLPNELPRDASENFGNLLEKLVLPALLTTENNALIQRATIASNGKLMPRFQYLEDYVYSKDSVS